MTVRPATPRVTLLRSLAAALALALPLAIGLAPVTALADNSCASKGGIGGTGYAPNGGIGGTGYAPNGGIGGTGAQPDGGIGGTGTEPGASSGGIGGTGSAQGGIGGTGAAQGGIGGTGAVAKGGIGGTGKLAKGGIGGTGRAVGVIGTITGFASVCVNGLEVHYASSTPVQSNGLPSTVADLAMGQVVSIEASAAGYQAAGELGGVKIGILYAVAGPIASADATARSFNVLGQTVRVTPQTLIADSSGIKDFSALSKGTLVRVSGLRLAGGDIVATRVETVLSLDQASVVGPVTQSDATGFSIYGLRVAYADITGLSPISSGEVMVSGRLDGNAMRPERIAMAPSMSFSQNIDHLVLEGYVGAAGDGSISVGGVKVAVSAMTQINGTSLADLTTDVRVQVTAHVLPDNSLVADFIMLRRDPMAPPAPQSILPPPRGKGLSFNRPGDLHVVDASDDRGVARLSSVQNGGTPTGGTATGGTSTGGVNTGGTSGGTLGGGSGSVSGGGTITPGGTTGTTTKPVTPPKVVLPVTFPRPHGFDAMDFRALGLARGVAH